MKYLLTSIPKSGTHLAQHTLELGQFFVPHNSKIDVILAKWMWQVPLLTGHIVPHPRILKEVKEEGWATIFLHREPRDTLVSMRHHCEERSIIWSPYCGWAEDDYDYSDGLLWLIENIKPWYDYMMTWTEIADYVITYEQITHMPSENVFKVSDALGLDRRRVVQRSKQKVRRYRTGKSGNWKEEFEPHHHEAFGRIWENQY